MGQQAALSTMWSETEDGGRPSLPLGSKGKRSAYRVDLADRRGCESRCRADDGSGDGRDVDRQLKTGDQVVECIESYISRRICSNLEKNF